MFDETLPLFRLGIRYKEFAHSVGHFGLFLIKRFFVTRKPSKLMKNSKVKLSKIEKSPTWAICFDIVLTFYSLKGVGVGVPDDSPQADFVNLFSCPNSLMKNYPQIQESLKDTEPSVKVGKEKI